MIVRDGGGIMKKLLLLSILLISIICLFTDISAISEAQEQFGKCHWACTDDFMMASLSCSGAESFQACVAEADLIYQACQLDCKVKLDLAS